MTTIVNFPPQLTVMGRNRPDGPQQASAKRRIKYKMILLKVGIAELVMGSSSILLGVIGVIYTQAVIAMRIGFTYAVPGIWCGIFTIASGVCAVCVKRNPSACSYITNMVFSILSAIMMVILFIISCQMVTNSSHGMLVINVLFMLLSLGLVVTNIIHASVCCACVCCKKDKTPDMTYTAVQPSPTSQYLQLANGQYMLVQNPNIAMPPVPVLQMPTPSYPLIPQQVPTQDPSQSLLVQPPQLGVNVSKENQPLPPQLAPQDPNSELPTYNSLSCADNSLGSV